MSDLFFDAEFHRLIHPLTPDERTGLEMSLKAHGNLSPIIVWKETRLLLDGHNRYDICHQNSIALLPPIELSLPDRDAATVWIIDNQLGRRNLSPYVRGVLALKREGIIARQAQERQEATFPHAGQKGFQPASVVQNSVPHNSKTQDAVAALAHVSHDTIARVKVIEERATPEQKAQLVNGDVSVNEIYVSITNRPHIAANSGENEWYTRKSIIEAAREVMGGIDLDPAASAASNEVVKALRFFAKEEDGLQREWAGRIWLNPPYAQPFIARFCAKLLLEVQAGHTHEAIAFVNNATETLWFQGVMQHASAACFPKGRNHFWFPGVESAPLQGQVLIYIGSNRETFARVFAPYGFVLFKPLP